MKLVSRSSFILAYCLAALAGYIDTLGFLHMSGYFVSFMSGNSTRLAVHLSTGNGAAALLLIEIIFGFISGALLGRLIGHMAQELKRPVILISVSILLLLASIGTELGFTQSAIFCMTLAMGTVNEVFQRDGKVVVAVTYMTGALVLIGQKVATALLGGDRFGWLPPLLLWLSLVVGGLTGASIYATLGLHGLWLSTAFAFGLAFINRRHHHNPENNYL